METETQVVSYSVTDAAITEMSEMYLPLAITDPEDKEQFDAVHSARMVVRGKRIEVDKRRKELKAGALAYGREVQSKANHIFELLEPIETHLKNEEGKADAEKERLETIRINAIQDDLSGWASNFSSLTIDTSVDELRLAIKVFEAWEISPETYFEFTTDAYKMRDEGLSLGNQMLETRERLDREEAERKAESERLALERKRQEEEAAKLKEQANRIAEVQRKMDSDRAIVHAAIKDERDALEAEKKAEQEKKDREQFEKEAKEQAEKDAKEAAEQAERDRIEKEKAEAAEKKRLETLKPDREKMIAFSQFLQEGVIVPVVTSDEAKKILKQAAKDIYDVGEEIIVATEKM